MDFSTALAIQSWVLYALAVSLVLARVTFRRVTLSSFSFLQADDWIMVSVLVPFTAVIAMTNSVSDANTSNTTNRRFAIEQLQLFVTWLVKACLLVLYWRIFPVVTSSFKRTSIKVISFICILSFLTIQICMIVWRVSKPNDSFLNDIHESHITRRVYCGAALSLGALTTLLVLIVPVPFIPTPRRYLLGILIFIGLLALGCGVVARVTHYTRYSSKYLFLYTTESSLIIIFANLPFLTAPARVRDFSRKLGSSAGQQRPLSHWPRSRGSGQVTECDNMKWGSVVRSSTTTVNELPSLKDLCDSSEKSYPSERGTSSCKDLEMQSLETEGKGQVS